MPQQFAEADSSEEALTTPWCSQRRTFNDRDTRKINNRRCKRLALFFGFCVLNEFCFPVGLFQNFAPWKANLPSRSKIYLPDAKFTFGKQNVPSRKQKLPSWEGKCCAPEGKFCTQDGKFTFREAKLTLRESLFPRQR